MMWGFLFLVPSQVPLAGGKLALDILPDALGWTMLVTSLGVMLGLHPDVRKLRIIGAVGVLIHIPRVVAFQPTQPPWQHLYLGLYVAGLAVALVFVWMLCGTIAAVASGVKARSIARGARWRRWLYIVPPCLLAVGLKLPEHKLPVYLLFMLSSICVVSLLMGLMASAARLCEHVREAGLRPEPAGAAEPVPEDPAPPAAD
jgi:hypothetical protein